MAVTAGSAAPWSLVAAVGVNHDMTAVLPRRRSALGTCLVLLALAGCSDDGGDDFDVSQQIGPDPVLPEPRRRAAARRQGGRGRRLAGRRDAGGPRGPDVTAYATDLVNPRTVHTLPNGDVLVVQSQGAAGQAASAARRTSSAAGSWRWRMAAAAAAKQESNLITLAARHRPRRAGRRAQRSADRAQLAVRRRLERRHALCRGGRCDPRLSLRARRRPRSPRRRRC